MGFFQLSANIFGQQQLSCGVPVQVSARKFLADPPFLG